MTRRGSITLHEASRRRWDVVIIGAGPAGAAAACALARSGVEVLLVDKAVFPREKVCGCCVNRQALASLDRLGMRSTLDEIDTPPLDRLRLRTGGRGADLVIDHGIAVSRGRLDQMLVERAEIAGACMLDGVAARVGSPHERSRTVHLRREGREATAVAAMILVCDGVGGHALDDEPTVRWRIAPRSRMGVAAILPHDASSIEMGTVEMRCARHGYVGLVRLEDGRVDLAAAVDPPWVKSSGGPGTAICRILHEAGGRSVSLDDATWMGTGLLTRRRKRVAGERFFVIGDAAGYVEPFTGEGIAWALRSAEAVVPLTLRALRDGWSAALPTIWSRRHRHAVRRQQTMCRLIASALRRPALMRSAAVLLARSPMLARPLVAGVEHRWASPLLGPGHLVETAR